jgi:hypothetical protein
MNNKFLIVAALLLHSTGNLFAQFISGFEDFPVDSAQGFYMGSADSDGFADQGLFFRNQYNAVFQYWDGFALSRKTDSVTAGFSNQFSCRAGRAWEGNTFALAYASTRIFLRRAADVSPRRLLNFRLCNSTYAARSMQTGDAFAKKFGGASGLDPDFFRLQVFNYLNGQITDSATFYLADYRASGTTNDYIIRDWIEAAVNFPNPFDSVGFELSSSDNGTFGMNTPAYFCMDRVASEAMASVDPFRENQVFVAPNPAADFTLLQLSRPDFWQLIDAGGRRVASGEAGAGSSRINLTQVPAGLYQLLLQSGGQIRICRKH